MATAVQKGQAEAAGVEQDACEVSCVAGGDGRRLAETVSFEYTITVANETEAASIAQQIKGTNITALTAKIVENLPSNSTFQNLEVTGVTAQAATITTTTTAAHGGHEGGGGGGDEFDDSHACTPAALGSAFMAAMAATMTWSSF